MINIKSFQFSPFEVNTFVVSDDSGECVIIDPGTYFSNEKVSMLTYISTNKLKPVALVNTHCHLDHVFGNQLVLDHFGLKATIHKEERPVLNSVPEHGLMFGMKVEMPPEPGRFINEGDSIVFGTHSLDVFHTPGHSPGGIVLYCKSENILFSGDVLFYESIGRTDLLLGDQAQLIDSIKTKLLVLPDETKVYPGHGATTSIAHEKKHNHYLN